MNGFQLFQLLFDTTLFAKRPMKNAISPRIRLVMTVGGGLVEGYTDVRMPGVICESESI